MKLRKTSQKSASSWLHQKTAQSFCNYQNQEDHQKGHQAEAKQPGRVGRPTLSNWPDPSNPAHPAPNLPRKRYTACSETMLPCHIISHKHSMPTLPYFHQYDFSRSRIKIISKVWRLHPWSAEPQVPSRLPGAPECRVLGETTIPPGTFPACKAETPADQMSRWVKILPQPPYGKNLSLTLPLRAHANSTGINMEVCLKPYTKKLVNFSL